MNGVLRPGGYDGLFWTAESSAVAQTYIPATGGATFCSAASFQLDDTVRPSKSDPFFTISKTIGPAPDDIQWDAWGRAKSWRVPPGSATYRDVANHIENVLGYTNRGVGGDRTYELLTDGWNKDTQEHCIVPADFKRQGSLVIAQGFSDMRFLDISRGESDLTDLQYHSHNIFARAKAEGYDGVVIDDFCQTKNWGNVGHRSIGFLDHAVSKLSTEVIPAVRFEWDPQSKDLQILDTPEFASWKAARQAQAFVHAATDQRRGLALA